MGINDIFQPNRADFTPMTDEPGVYAKHIEQSITVNIRTHANDQFRSIYHLFQIHTLLLHAFQELKWAITYHSESIWARSKIMPKPWCITITF